MIPTITSITMTRELVESILADYLNRAIFRTPVSVTGSEVIDESVILTLTDTELVATPNRITWTYPERSERIYTTTTTPIPGQLNGNGNGHHADADLVGADLGVRPDVVSAPAPTPEVTPVEPSKRRDVTPEEDIERARKTDGAG